jgi:MerR family transcriptional regulator, activator of bmr gene
MKGIIENVDALNMIVERSKDILNNNEISIKFLKRRFIIVAPCKEAGSLKELLYYSSLEKIIQGKNLEMSIDRGIIYDFNYKGKIKPRYVFSEFQGNDGLLIEDNIKILPEGNYLTLIYNKENEKERRRKILKIYVA